MDPNELSVILGLLTNGLYSLIIRTGNEVIGQAFRQDDIYEYLTRDKGNFASIIERAFQGSPLVIKQEEYCEFLKSNESVEIVKRIYSFRLYDCDNLNNLEKVEEEFCEQLALHFSGRLGVTSVAPQLFSILVECCLESLDVIIKEEQDLSALDYKNRFYLKVLYEKQSKYQERILKEIEITQILLRRFLETEPKNKAPYRQTPSPLNMAPVIETDFIQRDHEYKQLVEGLLNNQRDAAVAITTALHGAGGYGKTTLAKAVCHDPKIQKKFSDGILWVTLGENPKNLIGHIQDLIYRLNDKRPEFEGLEAATSYFKDLLHGKHLLIVIDDVWDSSHLEPFMQDGTECTLLITTRINDVLPEGTLEIRVDTMKNEEATQLLISGLTCILSWTEDQQINKLAKRLGYWPLLLKMVNSALRQYIKCDKNFEDALDHVNHKLDRNKLTAFDPKNPKKRNQAVEATINVSFDLLDKDESERYKELAIFPEDEGIHLNTVKKLWGETADYNDYDVEDLCYKLYNLSLLQTYDENKKIIKLHDVMRDYLNNKQQQEIYLTHSKFLEAYRLEKWADLPEKEIYLWRHLSYHLVEARRRPELRNLLLDFDWIQSKLNATDVHFLISDYDFFPEDYPVEMVKGAIRLSANALSRDKKLLGGQLLGRLGLVPETEINLMLEYIRKCRNKIRILPLTRSLTPPGGPLLHTLESHSDWVLSVSVTQDESCAISSSADATLKIWDLKEGNEIRTLKGHSNWVRAVSVTPDGNYVISASNDNTLKIWELRTGKEIRTLKGHSNWVRAVSVTPDGNYAISASDDTTLKIWDIRTGSEVHTLKGHSNVINAVSTTPDGNYAISASRDNTLKIWELRTGKEIRTLKGHSDWVRAVSVTPDGNYAISASADATLKIWDLRTGNEIRTLRGHSDWVNSVSVAPDGNYAISASNDNTLKVWDLRSGNEIRTLKGHSEWVNSVFITFSGNYAVSASDDKTLKVWDLRTEKEIRTLIGHSNVVNAVSVIPDSYYAISASDDNILKIWDIRTGNEIRTLKGHSDGIRAVSITPDGNYAISASRDNTLKIWDLRTGNEVHTLKGHSDWVRAVSVTPDGNYAISASDDRTLKVWDLRTGNEVHTLKGHSDWVRAVSVTPDGNYAISASNDNTLKVWDLRTGNEIRTLKGHSNLVNAICITPDGKYAVSTSADTTLKIWDLKTGRKVHTLRGHSDRIKAVSITPDGNYIVSASADTTLKIWNFKTGEVAKTLSGHNSSVNTVIISPDGNCAVSISDDKMLKVWSLKAREEISAFNGESPIVSVVFSSDGTIIVAGEQSGRMHFLLFDRGDKHYK